MKLSDITIENLIDYTGCLNNHEEYLKMLNILERKCDFIGITLRHEIVKKFSDDIICVEKSSFWWGIESSPLNIFYIKSSKELFEFLRKYETFCKYSFGSIEEGKFDSVETTSFGYSDIAFFDKDKHLLLRTNTHEGYIFVDQSIDKLFKGTK